VLHDIDETALTKAVLAEARIEIEAVEAAGRGDLTGRAPDRGAWKRVGVPRVWCRYGVGGRASVAG
jgi:hypothetical protein